MSIDKQQIEDWMNNSGISFVNKCDLVDTMFECFQDLTPKSELVSVFEELASRHIKCEICGCETISLYGGSCDNDRIFCTNKDCDAEYEFPTTTEPPKTPTAATNKG